MRSAQKTMALWALFVVITWLAFSMYEQERKVVISDFSYPKFMQAVDKQHIKKVSINLDTREYEGEVKEEFKDEYGGGIQFAFTGYAGDQAIKMLEEKGLTPEFKTNESSLFMKFAINWLPIILIIALLIFFMKQLQAGGGKAMSFGKSKARLLTENKKKVTFKDVAGVEEAKDDLYEIVEFLKDPKKFTRLGGRIPKGVLMVGSPGTGKTLLARAVAGEAKVPFFTISGSDFVEMFVGVGASRVRDLFEQGKKNAPCIIFIDEIDAVGRHRGAGMGGGHDEREQTLNQLLVEMDGFEGTEGVILIAATNRPDVLDPALLRPGRFDRRVVVNKPDLNGREQILKVHTRKVPIASNVDLKVIAKGTPGFSGADIENLVNESALIAARADKHKVDMSDFEQAKDKVLMGSERRSMVISEEDKKITAYHEAGHTLVGKMLDHMDPVHKVSIIPRGMALGVTQTLPEKESLNLSRDKARNMIAFLYGGRAAEKLIFENYTTGASNDIERATSLARSMVCEWGMSDKIGPISLESQSGPVFLGMQSEKSREFSEAKAQEVDSEIDRLIKEGYQRAIDILTDNKQVLVNLSEALLEYETINGVEVDMIIKGATLEKISQHRAEHEEKIQQENEKAKAEYELKEQEQKKKESKGSDPVGNSGPLTV